MKSTLLGASLLAALGLSLPLSAQSRSSLQSVANGSQGIPAGGLYVPPGSLFDNEQSDGLTSLASQNSAGTLTARTADDFRIPSGACSSGQFNISQFRLQMVQTDTAPQVFAVDLFNDDGTGNAPTAGLTALQTFAETAQTLLGPFALGTSIFEANFATPGLILNGDRTYWLSGFGTAAVANAAAFNNFFATSAGAAGSTDNAVLIAPGAGVPAWTPVQVVIGGSPLAFSFAVDGACRLTEADLSLTKSSGGTTAVPGAPLVYTLVASNAGPAPITGATVTDNFAAPLTACTWTCAGAMGGTCAAAGTGNIADSVNLPSGGTATYSATCSVPANATGSVSNTASIAGPGGGPTDPNAANNSATDTDTLTPEADLSVTISDAPDPVTAGTNLTYTLTVSNAGPSAAASVTVAMAAPVGTTLVTAPGAIGTLAAGASVQSTYVFALAPAVLTGTTITGTATAASTTPDPILGNNSATTTTAVITSADLRLISLLPSATATNVNVPVSFTATSQNFGPSDAQNVVVSVTLSPDFRYTSHTAAGATCSMPQVGTTGSLVCTWAGATAPSVSRTLQVVAFSNNPGSSAINALSSSGTTDPVPGNNSAVVNVQVGFLVAGIPTLGSYALVLLGLLLGLMGFVAARRHI